MKRKFSPQLTYLTLLLALLFSDQSFAFMSNLMSSTPKFESETTPYAAPQLKGISKWFNSKPLEISALKGKVVLIDFWTYSCINCIRTLPHMNNLQKKYADKGLVIIGIHAPEFDFEKNENNVAMAIKKFDIKYPVAMDNQLETWRSFDNQFWPAHYLIDQNGDVVYTHFGEGEYEKMENNIRALLKIAGKADESNGDSLGYFSNFPTPETYLGFARAERNLNGSKKFKFPNKIPLHYWALSGAWEVTPQYSESLDNTASLRLNFYAKKVFLVMSSASGKEVELSITLDNEKLQNGSGADVTDSVVKVKESRLYELVNMKDAKKALLEINAKQAGLRIYAFTFGVN